MSSTKYLNKQTVKLNRIIIVPDEDLPISSNEIQNLSTRQVSVLVGKLRDNPNVSIPGWWTESYLEDLLGRDISDEARSCFRDWYHRLHDDVYDGLPADIERFDWHKSRPVHRKPYVGNNPVGRSSLSRLFFQSQTTQRAVCYDIESAVQGNRVRRSLTTEGAVRFVEALLLRCHPRWEGFLYGSGVSGEHCEDWKDDA